MSSPTPAITPKTLVPPLKVKYGLRMLGGTLALFFVIFLLAGSPLVLVLCSLTVGLPGSYVVLVLSANSAAKSAQRRAEEQGRAGMLALIGRTPAYIDVVHSVVRKGPPRITASAIAWEAGTLYMMDQGVAAAIPRAAIRSWTWEVGGVSMLKAAGGGVVSRATTNMAASIDNAEARHAALKESGLFVSVADVAKPTWQFMTKDVTLLEKWAEILRQAEEGTLAGHKPPGVSPTLDGVDGPDGMPVRTGIPIPAAFGTASPG